MFHNLIRLIVFSVCLEMIQSSNLKDARVWQWRKIYVSMCECRVCVCVCVCVEKECQWRWNKMLLAAVAVSVCSFCFHFVWEKTGFLWLTLQQTDFIWCFRESTFFFFFFVLVFLSFLLFVIPTHPPPSHYIAPTLPERGRRGAWFIQTPTTLKI